MPQLSFACARAALALSLLAGAASGSVFTVLAGPTPGQPLFAGDPRNRTPGDITLGAVPTVTLRADVDGEIRDFVATLDFSASLGRYQRSGSAGDWVHRYSLWGSASFRSVNDGSELLRVNFSDALFESRSFSDAHWGLSATLRGDESFAQVAFATGGALAGLNVSRERAFRFELNQLRGAPGGVLVGLSEGLPRDAWLARGGFWGTAIPGPGTFVLGLVPACMAARRRRGHGGPEPARRAGSTKE
jgi:hypothetical protein